MWIVDSELFSYGLILHISTCTCSVLETTFGKADYKGKQKEIVEAAVLGADVFVGAPTGMGKACNVT